jgi:ectoine hydroxylase-related dioxygenase (phytanoyl-CoA dioxygenase family)
MEAVAFEPQVMSIEAFKREMDEKGWVVFDDVLEPTFVDELAADLLKATDACREIQIKNGIVNRTEGTSHHIIAFEGAFMRFIEDLPLKNHLRAYFDDGPFILNSFGGTINLASAPSYVANVHRDIRTFSGPLHLMLNMLVMLDDFTADNGATWFMSGSHKAAYKPSDEEFYANAQQSIGKRGSIVLFNSNTWHAAGQNRTGEDRRGLTPMFTKPFFKQQFDYARFFGYDRMDSFSEEVQQLLGYFSRVPANFEEWYQVPEKRWYRPNQG